jgi:hypothetical protein
MSRRVVCQLMLVLAVAGATPHGANAQTLAAARVGLSDRSSPPTRSMRLFVGDSAPRTEWKKGMIIGGVAGAVLGTVIYSFSRGMSDDPQSVSVAPIFILTALCSIIGGLIGSGTHRT